jgi:hypothetical protein
MLRRRAELAFALVAFACSSRGAEHVEARVECAGNAREPTIDCVVEHVAGKHAARVCWDLRYECNNQKIVSGTGFCLRLGPSTRAERRIPTTALPHALECDLALSSEVQNVRIEEN